MRARNNRGRRSSYPQIPDVDSHAAVATIWSVFCFLAAAVAITPLLISAESNLLPDRCWAANDISLRIPRFISLHDGWQFFRGCHSRWTIISSLPAILVGAQGFNHLKTGPSS